MTITLDVAVSPILSGAWQASMRALRPSLNLCARNTLLRGKLISGTSKSKRKQNLNQTFGLFADINNQFETRAYVGEDHSGTVPPSGGSSTPPDTQPARWS